MSYIIRPGRKKKQIVRNLLADIIMHESISINSSYIKKITKDISKLIGWAKKGDLHSRRLSFSYLHSFKNVYFVDKDGKKSRIIDKLFNILAERYKNRNGGYTRKTFIGNRKGDGSRISLISLV